MANLTYKWDTSTKNGPFPDIKIVTAFNLTVQGYGTLQLGPVSVWRDMDINHWSENVRLYKTKAEALAECAVKIKKANETLDAAWTGSAASHVDELLVGAEANITSAAQDLDIIASGIECLVKAAGEFRANPKYFYNKKTIFYQK